MNRVIKVAIAAFVVGALALPIWKSTRPRNRSQEVVAALKRAGYKEDDAGRIILTPDAAGLALAYDPNLHDPTIGLRNCISRINDCVVRTNDTESCIDSAPRCVSSTPWKDDPAGDDCCPESCVKEYHELRKTNSEGSAMMRMIRGTCYPGMKELLSGNKP